MSPQLWALVACVCRCCRATVDEEEAKRMVRYAIDQGVNYVDTAWSTTRAKASPSRADPAGRLPRARGAGDQNTHWLIEAEDFDYYFSGSWNLRTDHIDFYLCIRSIRLTGTIMRNSSLRLGRKTAGGRSHRRVLLHESQFLSRS